MPRTVFSMLTTTPRRRPSEGASPTPTMFNPRSVGSPTTQQILVVPISSAVTYLDRGKNLSWNVGWNRRAHYSVVPASWQHNWPRVIHRLTERGPDWRLRRVGLRSPSALMRSG